MTRSMSRRESRLVAILILVSAIALIWLGIVAPIMDGFADRAQQRTRLAGVYASNTRLIASISRLRVQAERQRRDRDKIRILAPDAATAGELLKARLSDVASAVAGQIRSVQDVEAESGWIGASIEARLTLPQLIGFLDRLRNQTPMLVMTSMSVSADRAASSSQPDNLDVHIEVAARHEHS